MFIKLKCEISEWRKEVFDEQAFVCLQLISDRLRATVGNDYWNKAMDELKMISPY